MVMIKCLVGFCIQGSCDEFSKKPTPLHAQQHPQVDMKYICFPFLFGTMEQLSMRPTGIPCPLHHLMSRVVIFLSEPLKTICFIACSLSCFPPSVQWCLECTLLDPYPIVTICTVLITMKSYSPMFHPHLLHPYEIISLYGNSFG